MKLPSKAYIWDFEDLKDSNLFTNEQLQYIRETLDDVLITKQSVKITRREFNYWINNFTTGKK